MQVGRLISLETNPATEFRGSLAQNAGLTLSLDAKTLGVGLGAVLIVRALAILSTEARSWEIDFFRSAQFGAATLANNRFAGVWNFANTGNPGDGMQIGGAGLYYYYVDGLYIPIRDEDQTSAVHVALVNRSAAAKSANDAGALRVQIALEMPLGG